MDQAGGLSVRPVVAGDGPLPRGTDTLLICAGFFGYAAKIRQELERRGRQVAYFEELPATDSGSKALIRIAPKLLRARADAYFAEIVAKLADCRIRDVLVIKGEALSPEAIRNMRAAFPGARFTLYLWDSFRNMPRNTRKKAALFDRVLTFDPDDARADPGMIYRPLFFTEEFTELPTARQDIDVLFFGTVHGDRHAVLNRIARALPPQLRFEKVLYFQARWLRFARIVEDPSLLWADGRQFIFSPKSKEEIAALIGRSRIVVDIERPVQSGYTIRTAEILGAGRKLITTNPEVAKADFFNPANIAVIDRKAPRISDVFLNAPYEPPPPQILQRYSLHGWLDEVLPDAS